ncbi:MAG: Crp/Fnr family transcriptional regulator [Alphaproteobacteria bacterium]
MDASRQKLGQLEIFVGLSPDELDALAKRVRWRRYGAKHEVFGHTDDSQDVYFVIEGSVRVSVYSHGGKEVSFRDLQAGEMFGELSAIDGQPRSAGVVTLTDTVLAAVTAGAFREMLADYPPVAMATLKRLTKLVRALSDRVFEFSALQVRNRIHAELLRMAGEQAGAGNTVLLSPAPRHADIASRVSTHREAVTRELNRMARAGMIERRGSDMVIRDVERLAEAVHAVMGD